MYILSKYVTNTKSLLTSSIPFYGYHFSRQFSFWKSEFLKIEEYKETIIEKPIRL